MKKVPIITKKEAAQLVKEGDTILQGGFGMTGNPVHLMHALAELGTGNLTFIGNNEHIPASNPKPGLHAWFIPISSAATVANVPTF